MNKINKKIRILVHADSPTSSTGFSQVTRGIFDRLGKSGKYDIDILGINERGGWHDPEKYPYKIYPARMSTVVQGDFHGRDRLASAILGKDPDLKPPWDIVFTLNDPQVYEQKLPIYNANTLQILKETQQAYINKLPPEWSFKTVSYFPVDSSLKSNWVQDAVALSDYPVAYTNYGKNEIVKADSYLSSPTGLDKKTHIIYHGVDQTVFKPIDPKELKEFKDEYFRGVVKADTFLVLVVARNQPRKDLPRTMAIFKEFQKRRPDSFLYIHTQESDVWGSLREYARQFNLEFGKDWGVPQNFNAGNGYPLDVLNLIYNSADAVISTSIGEGWGLHNSEAFATKTVMIGPNNTVYPELFGYKSTDDLSDMEGLFVRGVRGVPFKAGSTSSEWATYGPTDLERIRPLANVEDAVKKLIWVYDNPDKVAQIEDRAYDWIQQYTWDKIADEWDTYFQKVYAELEAERSKMPTRGKQVMKKLIT